MSGLINNDASLIEQYVRTGSDPAFRELVERHLPMVYATALRVVAGDSHLAQDVAQTVFTELARSAASLSGVESLGGWLYRVAYNMAANVVRTESRRRARERTAMEIDELEESSSAVVQWNQLAPVLDEALNQLDDRDRTAIVLRYLQSSDLHSIGAALGMSDDAAQKRIARALDKLRDFLKRRGLSFSAVMLAATLDVGARTPVPVGLAAAVVASSVGSSVPAAGVAAGIHSTSVKVAAVLVAGAVIASATVYVARNPDIFSAPPPRAVATPMGMTATQVGGGAAAATPTLLPVVALAPVPAAATATTVAATAVAETAATVAQTGALPSSNTNASSPNGNGASPESNDQSQPNQTPVTSANNNSEPLSNTQATVGPQQGQLWAVPLAGDIHLDLLPVSPGTFTMGSPAGELGRRDDETAHQVNISHPFWLGEFTVSRQQYSALTSTPPDSPIMTLPINVSWMQAEAFCQALTEQERAAGRLPAGYEYRLPTEAEWEYACRAGTTTPYYNGKGSDFLNQIAWYHDDLLSQPQTGPFTLFHPSGIKAPNAWGFYDMLGNMDQWCADVYAPYSKEEVTDPVGQLVVDQNGMASDGFHVMRGGNFVRSAVECRAAVRSVTDLDTATGFRVALAPVLPGLTGETGLTGWARMMSSNPGSNNIPQTPQLMATPDVLKGKTITTMAQGRPLVLCFDGTLVEWRLAGPWPPDDPPREAVPMRVDTSGVLAGKTIIALAAANPFSVVLCSDGTLAAWGDTKYFGSGDAASAVKDGTRMPNLNEALLEWHPNHVYTEAPMLVDTSGALRGKHVIAISASDWHVLALCSDGSVVEWGLDGPQQEINAAIAEDGPTQRYAARLVNTGSLSGRKAVAIAAGPNQNLALCADGTIASWGEFVGRQPMPSSSNAASVPLVVPTPKGRNSVPPNANPGTNRSGSLAGGRNAANPNTSPTPGQRAVSNPPQVEQPGYAETFGTDTPFAVNTSSVLAYKKDIVSISAGKLFSLALCADGTVVTWGDRVPAQAGAERLVRLAALPTIYNSAPVQVNLGNELKGARVAAIAATEFNAFVFGSDGTLLAWGQTDYPVNPTGAMPFYLAAGGRWIGDNGNFAENPAPVNTAALKGKVILGLSGANNVSSNLGGNLILFQTPATPDGAQASGNK